MSDCSVCVFVCGGGVCARARSGLAVCLEVLWIVTGLVSVCVCGLRPGFVTAFGGCAVCAVGVQCVRPGFRTGLCVCVICVCVLLICY